MSNISGMWLSRALGFLVCALTVQACQRDAFSTVPPGALHGTVVVRQLEPDVLLIMPDPDHPLVFVRHNGDKISPGRMVVFGGAMPQSLWKLHNYSAGYAAVFTINDWLFEVKHCKYPGFAKYTRAEVTEIVSEVAKTLMEIRKVPLNREKAEALNSVATGPSATLFWERGKCNPPPPGMFSIGVTEQDLIVSFQ